MHQWVVKNVKGRIREIAEVSNQRGRGVYLIVYVPKPHPTFTKGETEGEVEKKIKAFKTIHPGEIEFEYVEGVKNEENTV